jgi:hypothetical protein
MKKIFIDGILISLLLMNGNLALAKIIYYGSETESLTVGYDRTTILRFEEEVKTISQASKFSIEPADANDPNYRVLSIKPRSPDGIDKVTFILANDVVVNLKIRTVTQAIPEKTDSFYDLKSKEFRVDQSESIKGADVSELDLMKGMIRGDTLLGYNAKTLTKSISSGIDDLSVELIKIYTGPKFNGYVFKIVNESNSKRFAIDLKSLSLGQPNVALLSQVDDKILEPSKTAKGKDITLLRIVAKPSSVYTSIVLPIEPVVVK